MREFCPKGNIGRTFGTMMVYRIDCQQNEIEHLEGSILDPDHCIVTPQGDCLRHGEGDLFAYITEHADADLSELVEEEK